MKREALRAEDLLREMRSAVAPVDSERAVHERRARTIGALRGAQGRLRAERGHSRLRRRWRWIAAAALVPAVAAAFAVYRTYEGPVAPVVAVAAAPTMRIRALEGRVDVIHEGRRTAAQTGIDSRLEAGDAIRTLGASRAAIALPSGASVQAAASTNLAVSLPDPGRRERVELSLGRVDVSVPKLAPGSNLSVHTPHATVTVHGTRFSVVVLQGDRDLETTVAVTEGVVSVERDGRSVDLTAGNTWSSAPERTPSTDEKPIPSQPSVATRAARTAAGEVGAKQGPRAGAARTSQANFTDERSSTLSEENALMERAMVSSRNGDDRGALALFDTLLARYPHSILNENATVERFRALRRLGNADEASREARHYLAEHPEGLGKDEAKQIAVDPRTP